MKITIVQVGKTKNSFFIESEQEYSKRLRPLMNLNIITLKEYPAKSANESERNLAMLKEGELILKNIREKSYCVALNEKGEQLDSREFSQFLEKQKNSGNSEITFIIGGPFGLSDAVKRRANKIISFSRFTFTHEIIRTLLLEQLYRAQTILSGKTYHY